MGSFASTCCVSGFPIEYGDDVYYFLLTENPYQEHTCYIYDLWFPRTWPLKAKYNDYGSVEDVEEGPEQDVWLKGFQTDLVELGTGDNSVHDVPIKKDMTFAQLLDALWEKRVSVLRDTKSVTKELKQMDDQLEIQNRPFIDYIPTMNGVEKTLSSIVCPKGHQFLVDEMPDSIRVRWSGYGEAFGQDQDWLSKVQALFPEFSTVITAGSGSYSHKAELRVFVSPGTVDIGGERFVDRHVQIKKDDETPLLVKQAMIRADVWEALCKLKINTWENKNLTVTDYVTQAQAFVKSIEQRDLAFALRFGTLISSKSRDPGSYLMVRNPIPFTMALVEHLALLKGMDGASDSFVKKAAEFTFIQDVLGGCRYIWHPTYTAGPQFDGWEEQSRMHRELSKVIRDNLKIKKAERAKWREEERDWNRKEKEKLSKKKDSA